MRIGDELQLSTNYCHLLIKDSMILKRFLFVEKNLNLLQSMMKPVNLDVLFLQLHSAQLLNKIK